MNEIREIVTKAVVGKGKKKFTLNERIKPTSRPFSVLGCWIINNEFKAIKNGDNVDITGSFEVNIWYSHDNNSSTDVTKKVITYRDSVPTREVVQNTINSDTDVVVKMIQQPTCVDAKLTDEFIDVEIIYEALAEIIGETKMKVTVFNPLEQQFDEEDFDPDIDEDFLTEV